jgi:hypothetical protein
MARESTSGSKQLVSLFLDKEVVRLLREEAEKQHRKISGQAELILSDALLKGNK